MFVPGARAGRGVCPLLQMHIPGRALLHVWDPATGCSLTRQSGLGQFLTGPGHLKAASGPLVSSDPNSHTDKVAYKALPSHVLKPPHPLLPGFFPGW